MKPVDKNVKINGSQPVDKNDNKSENQVEELKKVADENTRKDVAPTIPNI
jgi:hypothetical protein